MDICVGAILLWCLASIIVAPLLGRRLKERSREIEP